MNMFAGRLAAVLMLALQSPFMHTKTGKAISPIGLITKFVVENSKKEGGTEMSDNARTMLRVLNWPAHMFDECVLDPLLKGKESNCDPTFVYERAIPHAVKETAFYGALPEQSQQILFGGCTTTVFGSIVSLATGRTHLLALLGSGLLGYGMFLCELTPTFQYVVCLLIAFLGIRSRATTAGARFPAPPPTDPPPQASAAKPAAASSKKGRKAE